MLRILVFAVAFLALCGCATTSPSPGESTCQVSGDVIRVIGPTDSSMLGCLEKFDDFSRVEITSAGGSVRSAIAIGEKLAAMQVELAVAGYCESSCANYLVPVARTLVVRTGARLVLHGSVDQWAVARGASASLYETQRVFAQTHSIPPGWLLMRTEADAALRRHGDSITFAEGEDETGDAAFIIVDSEFLASCLPRLPVTWEAPSYVTTMISDPRLARRLQERGFRPSGGMRCAASP